MLVPHLYLLKHPNGLFTLHFDTGSYKVVQLGLELRMYDIHSTVH